ncbi:haloacid dehalogenase type II [Thalassospira lucentensis]|uniref:(S)-2-haloacid dehalogenase n=1 Tax=Thalassospira lucentensis TaxID=168935 RepID=A0A358HSR1_9PROT|nr:haloacid dehalogenase type II [Thalassospira lucentensis]HBU98193.1 haloacid dehalogenase type II [Thalassospira lucentensis]HCW66895.1 haloacid dehalogenase type II [Thalassospira lucentensis]
MSDKELSSCRAFVFDAYGTLFDVGSAVAKFRDTVGDEAERLSAVWRQKQLEYTWLRSLMGDFTDFWTVTGDALDFAMEQTGKKDPVLRAKLMETYLSLDTFPEVVETLKTLKSQGHKLAILSNGAKHMLISAAKSSGILTLFDHIICVDDLKTYKPHPDVYQLAVDQLEVNAAEISFQSSNGWDIAGAGHFGFRTAWINRSKQPMERLSHQADVVLNGLDELLPLIEAPQKA